jgi:hypothetical protein
MSQGIRSLSGAYLSAFQERARATTTESALESEHSHHTVQQTGSPKTVSNPNIMNTLLVKSLDGILYRRKSAKPFIPNGLQQLNRMNTLPATHIV